MRKLVELLTLFGILLVAGILNVSPAQAQATRTWVSGVGDDVNPCSRTAPCKTFAGAISKTAVFGEINCIDPGGFGGVTITKSITIACDFTEAGVLVSGTNAITVNAAASDIVTLRGLDIEGLGSGISGINVVQVGVLHVQKVQIRGFRGGGNGITFAPNNIVSELHVTDSHITDNGSNATTGGILIRPTGTGSAFVTVNRSQVVNNSSGIRADAAATTGSIRGVVRSSMVAGNIHNGIAAVSGAAVAFLAIEHSSIMGNNYGLVVNGANTYQLVSNSNVTANNTGLFVNVGGGQLASTGNNTVQGNATADGVFTGLIPLK